MITQDQAAAIAAHVCGAPPNDRERGWELKEFDAGWFITERAKTGRRGGDTRVIERESGLVISFPSFVPPSRIKADYDEVREDGMPRGNLTDKESRELAAAPPTLASLNIRGAS